VFLDFSESMISAAKKKLRGVERGPLFLVCANYADPAWVRSVHSQAPFDLIVSGFSIHHQPDHRKRQIYAEVFSLLASGGMFLNLEHVASASPFGQEVFDQYFVDALCTFHRKQGTKKTDEQIAGEYYHRPDKAANILAPVDAQCGWIREIGFSDVDCYFKIFELALFGGIKPSDGGSTYGVWKVLTAVPASDGRAHG